MPVAQVVPVGQLALVTQPFAVGVMEPVIVGYGITPGGQYPPLGQLMLVVQLEAVGHAELVMQTL
jgi:hypothetical protein